MGATTKHWYHITISTYGSWLPGDPRGWRSRNHRLHSSGDHRHPPPAGEHKGLHRHAKTNASPTVILPKRLRPLIGQTLRDHFQKLGHRVLVLCVSGQHVHVQVELARAEVRREVGRCKRLASLAVRSTLPGKVWAKDCGVEPIHDHAHQRNVFGYITRHAAKGAWVWTFRDGDAGDAT